MDRFLREWRQDALNKAQYDAAIFLGDKLLALTNSDDDAFWLAQVHFVTGNYTRACAFLSGRDLISRNPSCRYLAGHCLVKQQRFEEALTVLGERDPTHLILPPGPGTKRKAVRHPNTVTSAITASQKNRSHRSRPDDSPPEQAAERRYEAAMCFLRGICYAKQNAFDRAKDCYKNAVRIDILCFEAFHQLMQNSLLSPDEEWQLLESLDFDSLSGARIASAPLGGIPALASDTSDAATARTHPPSPYLTSPLPPAVSSTSPASPLWQEEAAEFVRMLYTTQLSKYRNPAAFEAAFDSLSSHYGLADNPDLLLARADLLYTQCRHRDALEITAAILTEDRYKFSAYPLHVACLFELGLKNQLFLVAHNLADTHPDEPCTWLAVGTYYFLLGWVAEARRYFSKASMMDVHFGPAWIGFAHTFAAEGEHDQAISAYSTAARLFMGTHLPQVFLGMQNHALNNMNLAEEFLKTAFGLCRTDPLLLNEMGVVKYHQDQTKDAVAYFHAAMRAAEDLGGEPAAWLPARINLGHALRRLGHPSRALAEFEEALRQGGKDAAVLCAQGLVLMELDRPSDAIAALHEALAISPQDTIATELLSRALAETATLDHHLTHPYPEDETGVVELDDDEDMIEFENELVRKKAEAAARVSATASQKGKAKAVTRPAQRAG